jgi:glucosylceramidase
MVIGGENERGNMVQRHIGTIVFAAGFFFFSHAQINISGTVSDSGTTAVIQGAIVSLAGGNATSISDNAGHYALGGSVAARSLSAANTAEATLGFSGNRLHFRVPGPTAQVRIEAFTLSGRRVGPVFDRVLAQGEYDINPFSGMAASQVCLLRMRIGSMVTMLKVSAVGRLMADTRESATRQSPADGFGLAKSAVGVDTLIAWAVGYDISKLALESLAGTHDIKLRFAVPAGGVQVVQTSQAGDKLAVKPALTFAADDGSAGSTITVEPAVTYQSMVGFGAAFTETSVWNLTQMGAAATKEIWNAYFNPYTGSGYTFTRTHINSCDFCIANYSYDNVAGDYTLDHFDISHELTWMIPRIKEALAVPGSDFILFGSPWAPPAWMKTTNKMQGGGELKPDCYEAWALYYVKYIEAMEKNGVPIWGVTIQNEPEYSPTWEGCRYTDAQERDFLKNHLGPMFKLHNRDEKIMIFDHNKDHVAIWAQTILGDTAAAKYAWGTAYHWYSGDQFENLAATHDIAPAKQIIGSECSLYDSDFGKYSGGERMARSMIGDINNWSAGYQTWNLVCDVSNLGPSDVNTKCPSPIMVDVAAQRVEYEPDYYYMTHFSRYVRPGAVRLKCSSDNINLQTTAFKNPDGAIVVLALNQTAAAISFKLKQGTQIVTPTIPAHAFIDFIYR